MASFAPVRSHTSHFRMHAAPSLSTLTLTLTLALTVGSITVRETLAGDWSQWRGPDRTGISTETGWSKAFPADGPKVLWTAEVGTGFASVTVADGRVFTTGNADDKDTIYAFDAGTGKTLWKHSYPHPLDEKYYEGGTSATPTVDGGRVYTLSRRGHLHCLEAATGKVVWSKNLANELGTKMPTWGYAGSVVIDGDKALVNVGNHGAAVDKQTGRVLWHTGKDEAGYSSFVPMGSGAERVYLVFSAKSVAALRPDNGQVVWSHPWETSYDVNGADPIVVGPNRVVISSGYERGGALLEIQNNRPRVVWENKNLRTQFNAAVYLDGHLYGIDGNTGKAQMRCLDVNTGQVKWTFRDTNHGALMIADGQIIVVSEKGELMIGPAQPSGFRPTARGQVAGGKFWTVPVLANGQIYVRNSEGLLTCVDVRR